MSKVAGKAIALLTMTLIVVLFMVLRTANSEEDASSSHVESVAQRRLDSTNEGQEKPTAVRIGEDCSLDDTACEYFRPTKFMEEESAMIDEVVRLWKMRSIDDFCARTRPWAVEMFGFDCDEEGVAESSEFCRPSDSQDVDALDPEMDPYWFLPVSFTFKHIRKAGGNSFLRSMWGIDANETPQFHVTKMRASIDGMDETDKMAMDRMDVIERDQKSGTKNHPLFLTVRNPLSRFVSSVSEVLFDVEEVQQACWQEDDGTSVLRCVLDMVENGLNNIHTIPMFADIYCNVKGRDVEVSMYDLKDMRSVLSALGLRDDENANPSKFKLSVSDLDDDMVRRICALYLWDVSMMEVAGFEVPECQLGVQAS